MSALEAPPVPVLENALDELMDVAIAAQLLASKWQANWRPLLALRARELHGACCEALDALEAIHIGWEPVPDADR